MKSLLLALMLFASSGLSQQKSADGSDAERKDLGTALAEAGSSPIEFMRALEGHLAKYPMTEHRAEIERAMVKSAIEAKDDARIARYGEKVLARENGDLQILDRVARALLASDSKENAEKALDYARRYQTGVQALRDKPAPGQVSAGKWQDELDRGIARALVLEARAAGNLGKAEEAATLAQRSYNSYPTAEGAREIGRWLARAGKGMEAVEHIADAFTIEDPKSTEIDRGKDRVRMGELYTKANGSEKGLGDIILQAYDRSNSLIAARVAKLRALDPNASAQKVLEFTVPGVSGDSLSLSSLRGKTVVLDFWATWCGPCRAQHPLYEKVQEKFKNQPDVVFLAIDTDEDRSLVAPFLAAQHWTSRVYFEAGLQHALEISSIPTTIVVDRNGQIASRIGFIPDRFVDMLIDRIQQTLKN